MVWTLLSRLCGICGNYNDNPNDDAMDATGKLVSCGSEWSCNNPQLGNSFEVPDYDSAPGLVYFSFLFELSFLFLKTLRDLLK